MSKESLTVYWAPANFIDVDPITWYSFYSEPKPLLKELFSNTLKAKGGIQKCPAVKDILNNVYYIEAVQKEHINFSQPLDSYIDLAKNLPPGEKIFLPDFENLSLEIPRPYNYEDYLNIRYNMSWVFFAEESLDMKFTAPWFPPSSPTPGAMLSPGILDIGQWFRQIHVEYMIPKDAKSFNLEVGDQLAYLEFKTEKKIEFKQFKMNEALIALANEYIHSSNMSSKGLPLKERYRIFGKTKIRDAVLKEIKQNLL